MASSNIPSTQSGVQIERTGGREVLQYKTDLPVPQPKEGQILVKNEFIGVNFIDTYYRTGLYAATLPLILGREASGTIVAVGPQTAENAHLNPGDRVAYTTDNTSYAQYTATKSNHVAKVPDSISSAVAAASMIQGLTAITMIREGYAVQKGDWILVHAAAGGVGLWLVQLLKAVGARTIATASTSEKLELARKAGAEVLVNYSHEDVKAKVDEATGGKGVAAVLDGVGKATFDLSLDCVARKGTLISFGNASGAVPPVTIARLSAKCVKLMRPTLFPYLATKEEFEGYVNDLWGFIERKEVDVRIHGMYDLKDVAKAHEDLEGRKTTGKLLLRPEA